MVDVTKNLTGLQPNQQYIVQVRAKGEGNSSEWSNAYTFSTPSALLQTKNQSVCAVFDGGAIASSSSMWMDKDGLHAFSPSGASTVYISSTTGDAYFSGSIVSGAGNIGGWSISSNALTSGNVGFYAPASPANSDIAIFAGSAIASRASAAFRVDYAGNMTATHANISGSVNATSGSIGGFLINNNNLSNSASTIVLSSTTGLTLGSSSEFRVDLLGNLTAKNLTASGNINATSGYIGGATGWAIGSGSIRSGGGSGSIILDGTNNKIYIGAGTYSSSTTSFYVDSIGQFSLKDRLYFDGNNLAISGSISAASGNIGGWSIGPSTIFKGSGASAVVLDSANSKIYIGTGNHASKDTGFYVDSAGNFSLGNQLIFKPSSAGTLSNSTEFTSTADLSTTSASITNVTNSSSVVVGMTITGSGIPIETYVLGASGNTIWLSKTPTVNTTGASVNFHLDDFADLTISGRIHGIVDSVQPVPDVKLNSGIISASTNSSASLAVFTTNGHAFIIGERVTFSGLPGSNGASALNYSISGSAYVVYSAPDSKTFSVQTGTLPASGNATGLTASANLQELTLGLHPGETGTASHNSGTGIRLDNNNWWFTNNQFRVGTASTYLKWDGSQIQLQGGSNKQIQLNVSGTDTNNNIAIVQSGSTASYNASWTPFYAGGDGKFSLGNQLTWDGSGLFVSGSVNASSGSIGGWSISSPLLYSGNSQIVPASAIVSSSTLIYNAGNSTVLDPSNSQIYLSKITGTKDYALTRLGAGNQGWIELARRSSSSAAYAVLSLSYNYQQSLVTASLSTSPNISVGNTVTLTGATTTSATFSASINQALSSSNASTVINSYTASVIFSNDVVLPTPAFASGANFASNTIIQSACPVAYNGSSTTYELSLSASTTATSNNASLNIYDSNKIKVTANFANVLINDYITASAWSGTVYASSIDSSASIITLSSSVTSLQSSSSQFTASARRNPDWQNDFNGSYVIVSASGSQITFNRNPINSNNLPIFSGSATQSAASVLLDASFAGRITTEPGGLLNDGNYFGFDHFLGGVNAPSGWPTRSGVTNLSGATLVTRASQGSIEIAGPWMSDGISKLTLFNGYAGQGFNLYTPWKGIVGTWISAIGFSPISGESSFWTGSSVAGGKLGTNIYSGLGNNGYTINITNASGAYASNVIVFPTAQYSASILAGMEIDNTSGTSASGIGIDNRIVSVTNGSPNASITLSYNLSASVSSASIVLRNRDPRKIELNSSGLMYLQSDDSIQIRSGRFLASRSAMISLDRIVDQNTNGDSRITLAAPQIKFGAGVFQSGMYLETQKGWANDQLPYVNLIPMDNGGNKQSNYLMYHPGAGAWKTIGSLSSHGVITAGSGFVASMPNMISDPSFESGTAAWNAIGSNASVVLVSNPSPPISGASALQISNKAAGSNAYINLLYSANANQWYTFSAYVKAVNSASVNGTIVLQHPGSFQTITSFVASSANWTRVYVTSQSKNSGTGTAYLTVDNNSTASSILWYDSTLLQQSNTLMAYSDTIYPFVVNANGSASIGSASITSASIGSASMTNLNVSGKIDTTPSASGAIISGQVSINPGSLASWASATATFSQSNGYYTVLTLANSANNWQYLGPPSIQTSGGSNYVRVVNISTSTLNFGTMVYNYVGFKA